MWDIMLQTLFTLHREKTEAHYMHEWNEYPDGIEYTFTWHLSSTQDFKALSSTALWNFSNKLL